MGQIHTGSRLSVSLAKKARDSMEFASFISALLVTDASRWASVSRYLDKLSVLFPSAVSLKP